MTTKPTDGAVRDQRIREMSMKLVDLGWTPEKLADLVHPGIAAERDRLRNTCRMLLTRVRDANWPRTTAGEKLDKIAIKRAEAALAKEE